MYLVLLSIMIIYKTAEYEERKRLTFILLKKIVIYVFIIKNCNYLLK